MQVSVGRYSTHDAGRHDAAVKRLHDRGAARVRDAIRHLEPGQRVHFDAGDGVVMTVGRAHEQEEDAELAELRVEVELAREVVAIAVEALNFYARAETYHAIRMIGDPPCGGFADDCDDTHGDESYVRLMPGAFAREALRKMDALDDDDSNPEDG